VLDFSAVFVYIKDMANINIAEYITVDPNVCNGKPCFKGTRIMVYLVLEMLAGGENVDDIQKAYPGLTKQHIDAALLFAAKTTETGERYVSFSK
jgi:uncharacterized protein (DUF433 family)